MTTDRVSLFLCGDVMTGRGLDQVLPHPGDPSIHESYATSAELYVALAGRMTGPIRRPVDFQYIWGDALDELARAPVDARIINLETSITRSDDRSADKGIHYRMHPDNVPCITAAGIDCCVLANNHVLDYGRSGLCETLETLGRARVRTAGAGQNLAEAEAPAVVDLPDKAARVVVFAFGTESSGIPPGWEAGHDRPGISVLDDLSDRTLDRIARAIRGVERPRDVIVVSIHWGDNWGFDVPEDHVRFAHDLIRAGADVVHGHSSHHVRPIEVFEQKLVLYGCGDFLNDYEGIGGHEAFRSDLALMYFAAVNPASGELVELRMRPMQVRHFRVNRASPDDAEWLRDTLDRESRRFGVRLEIDRDGSLVLRQGRATPVHALAGG